MAFIVIILILAGITTSASTTTTTNSTKLELLHRERERNGNYSHWFQQRMKRDTKRVACLMNRMEQVDFVGEVVSGVNEGVGEYIIPIEIGSPPIAQHVIMDNGSDLIWIQCQKCQQCHSQFDLIFDPAKSSSYTEIPYESSTCDKLNGKDSQVSGSLVIGREAISTGSVWVPLLSSIRNPTFYYVRMIGLGVGGIWLLISEDIFHLTESGDGGVIIDLGTISDIGEVSLVIPPRNFLVAVNNMGTACFAFAPSPASFSIIGNIQQKQIKISYDTVSRTLGFGPDLCM
ncbi:hypothetical protein SO802_019903 [Lithocarpus litseifolius]|uniref:Peptidase A1 domain-containing protein n=1 Tax=Lithocarpus litseifolius TaxID=425828 RepID=A0AAW2CTG9_9ROSI